MFDTAAGEAYADAPMEEGDVEHLVSMFWPDVRLKRFVEIRPADCVPLPQVLGYAALVKGLFYSEDSPAAVEDALRVRRGVVNDAPSPDHWSVTPGDVAEVIRQIEASGFGGLVYGRGLAEWEDGLFALARAALPADEGDYLAPLESFSRDKPWRYLPSRASRQ